MHFNMSLADVPFWWYIVAFALLIVTIATALVTLDMILE